MCREERYRRSNNCRIIKDEVRDDGAGYDFHTFNGEFLKNKSYF
jgi:hypothetical protein